MKARSCLAVVLILFALVGAATPILGGWLSLGGNFQRTGLSEYSGPVLDRIAWQFPIGGAVTGSITVGSGIHIPCEDGKLYTLDSYGNILWVLDVNTPLQGAASVAADGSLYVGGRDGVLYAVSPEGELLWTYETGDAIYSSPAISPNGDIYVGSGDGTLYALGPNGAESWRFTTDGPGVLPAGAIIASPAIDADGTVYVAGLFDPNLYALNPDGMVKWMYSFTSADGGQGGWPFASPVVAGNGAVYQTLLHDSRLYAIAAGTGTLLWATDMSDPAALGVLPGDIPPGGDGWSEPVLGPDGTIYVNLDDPYLRAVTPDGDIQWATRLGELGGFTMTVDRNGRVYAASDDGFVYIVDSAGNEITRVKLGGWPIFPVIAAEDMLIVADSKDYSGLEKGGQNFVWAISPPIPKR